MVELSDYNGHLVFKLLPIGLSGNKTVPFNIVKKTTLIVQNCSTEYFLLPCLYKQLIYTNNHEEIQPIFFYMIECLVYNKTKYLHPYRSSLKACNTKLC